MFSYLSLAFSISNKKENDKPTLHRINPDGNYDWDNIAMLPHGKHLKEHAKPVIVFDMEDLKLTTYESQTEFRKVEGLTQNQVNKMNQAFKEDKKLKATT